MKKEKKPNMTASQKITKLSSSKKKGKFFQEMKDELKKVSWTTKEELRLCTKIVLIAIFLLGLGIYGIDLSIRFVLDGIGSLLKLLGA